jgi:adenylate cyclase
VTPHPHEHDNGFVRELAGLTTFVGRETERDTLRSALQAAAGGKAGVAMIGGPPGVGKTRLAREIGAEAAQRGFRALGGCCYDRDELVPFVPFVEILQAAFHRAPSPEIFRDALGPNLSEIARLMPQLRRTFADTPPSAEVSSDQSRLVLFSAITEVLIRAAAEGPLLLLLDDLQWADEGTLSLLTHLARAASNSRVMIVGTYRDNELDPAGPLARTLDELARLRLIERINLSGLPRDSVAEMVSALSSQEAPRNIVEFIYSGTEGNPFFVEALYGHLVEKGEIFDAEGEFRKDAMTPDVDVPEELRLVFARRLAKLSPGARKMLSTAAVIGRSFNFEFLQAAVEIEADALIDYVEEADRAGLITETPRYREPGFQFSHELIRQAVIADLSAPRRQRLHLALAETIERIYPNELEEHADDLAHHLWNAGNLADAGKAEKYLSVAARAALAKCAYSAAANRFKNALTLLKQTPDSIERKNRELSLQLEYGVALAAANGWYVKEFGEAHERAFELCRQLGEDPRLFTVLFGLWEYRLCQGNHATARRHADEMLQLAELMRDDATLVGAHWGAGCSRMAMGELTDAHNHFEKSAQLYNAQRDRKLAFRFGQDPCMTSLCYDAVTLFILGYPERAERSMKQSIVLARKLGYPFTLAWCLCNVVKYYLFRNDFDRVEGVVREALELTEQYDLDLTDIALHAYHIIAQIELGQDADLSFQPGRGRLIAREFELFGTWTRALLAEGFANRGQCEFAFQLLAQASEMMERNRELYFESEIRRIQGDTILKRVTSAPLKDAAGILAEKSAAEEHFRAAIDIARQRSARMFQLRAATSLARLMIEQHRNAEARQVLKDACAGFTEGFNEREFKAASQMLDSIG